MHRIPDLISGEAVSALALAVTSSPVEGPSNPFSIDDMPHNRDAAESWTKGKDPDGEGGRNLPLCSVCLDQWCQRCFIFGLARLPFIPLETLGSGIDFTLGGFGPFKVFKEDRYAQIEGDDGRHRRGNRYHN